MFSNQYKIVEEEGFRFTIQAVKPTLRSTDTDGYVAEVRIERIDGQPLFGAQIAWSLEECGPLPEGVFGSAYEAINSGVAAAQEWVKVESQPGCLLAKSSRLG